MFIEASSLQLQNRPFEAISVLFIEVFSLLDVQTSSTVKELLFLVLFVQSIFSCVQWT